MMMNDMKDSLMKGAVVGVVAATGSMVLFEGSDQPINVMGMNIPAYLLGGIGSFAGSLITDVGHNYILPVVQTNQKWIQYESIALGIGLSGASSTLVLGMLPSDKALNVGYSFGLGAGSYIIGDYIYYTMLAPTGTKDSLVF